MPLITITINITLEYYDIQVKVAGVDGGGGTDCGFGNFGFIGPLRLGGGGDETVLSLLWFFVGTATFCCQP